MKHFLGEKKYIIIQTIMVAVKNIQERRTLLLVNTSRPIIKRTVETRVI